MGSSVSETLLWAITSDEVTLPKEEREYLNVLLPGYIAHLQTLRSHNNESEKRNEKHITAMTSHNNNHKKPVVVGAVNVQAASTSLENTTSDSTLPTSVEVTVEVEVTQSDNQQVHTINTVTESTYQSHGIDDFLSKLTKVRE